MRFLADLDALQQDPLALPGAACSLWRAGCWNMRTIVPDLLTTAASCAAALVCVHWGAGRDCGRRGPRLFNSRQTDKNQPFLPLHDSTADLAGAAALALRDRLSSSPHMDHDFARAGRTLRLGSILVGLHSRRSVSVWPSEQKLILAASVSKGNAARVIAGKYTHVVPWRLV